MCGSVFTKDLGCLREKGVLLLDCRDLALYSLLRSCGPPVTLNDLSLVHSSLFGKVISVVQEEQYPLFLLPGKN